MKVVFVYTGEEYLGIEYLSAILKKNGHQTYLIYDPLLFNDYYISNQFLSCLFSFHGKIIKEIIDSKADLIAFSANTGEYNWAAQIASIIKDKIKVPIVFGGHHPTCLPEEVIREEFVDFVIQGEGEYVLLELVEHLEGKRSKEEIRNLYYKSNGIVYKNELRPLIENLDSLPFPDKDLFYQRMNYLSDTYRIMTSRGCPFSCSYCHNYYLQKLYQGKGKFLRRRSVTNVIQEIKEAKEKYKITGIMFQDEIFTLHHEWLKEFMELYKKEIALPFACYIHVGTIDEETIFLLRDSGCVQINMGIESLDEKVREEIFYRFIKQSKIIDAAKLMKKYHIHCRIYFIIGYPGQNRESLIDIARFCNEYKFASPMIFWLHYFPKTALAEIVKGNKEKQEDEYLKRYKKLPGYILGGETFNSAFSKLRFLIILVPLFSRRTLEYIIRKRIYRFFPASQHLLYLQIINMFRKIYRFLLGKSKGKKIPKIASIPVA